MQSYYAPSSNRVRLDDYICDLNLEIAPGGYACYPLSAEGFSYMWGGCKATYGIRTGKVCFEVKITDHCDVTNKDMDTYVTRVGWSTDSATLQLGEDKNSFGFGGTGKKSVNRKFANYGRRFEKGDVVGCYLAMENGWVDISYSVNGRYCGSAFKIRWMTDEALFPHILTKNCKLEVNFGQAPHPYFSLQPGYKLIDHVPSDFRIPSIRPPASQSDCEIIMMVGLPGVGKSTWAMNYAKIHPSKKYALLGTDSIIDKMRILGLPRKNNFGGRWDMLIKQATDCFNVLLKKASNLPINLILDQTNVYASARRRKVKQYRAKGYTINAMVLVPRDEDMTRRSQQRTIEEGKEVPESAVLDMKANFSLPDESERLFDGITFLELQRAEAQMLVEQYNAEAMSKGHRSNLQKQQGSRSNDRYHRFPPSNPREDDRSRPPASNSRHSSDYGNQNAPAMASKWEDEYKGSKKRPESTDFGPPEKFRRNDSPKRPSRSQAESQSFYSSDSRQDPYGNRESNPWERNQAPGGRPAPPGTSNDTARPPPRQDERNPYQRDVARQPPQSNESGQQPWSQAYSNVKTEPNRYENTYSRPREADTWQGQGVQNQANSYYNDSQQQPPYKPDPPYGNARPSDQGSYPTQQTDSYSNYGNQPVKSEASNFDKWPQGNSQGQASASNVSSDGRPNYQQDNQYNKTNDLYQPQQGSYYGDANSSYNAPKREPSGAWGGGDGYNNNPYQQNQNYNNQDNSRSNNSSGFDQNTARNPSQPWQNNPNIGKTLPQPNNELAERRDRPMGEGDQPYSSDGYQHHPQYQDNRALPSNPQQGYPPQNQQQQQHFLPQRDAQPPRPSFPPQMNQGPYPQQNRGPPSSFQDPGHGASSQPSLPREPFPPVGGGHLGATPGVDRGEQRDSVGRGRQDMSRQSNNASWDEARDHFGSRERNESKERFQHSEYDNRGRAPVSSQSTLPPSSSSFNPPFDNRQEQERAPGQSGGWQGGYQNEGTSRFDNRSASDTRQPDGFGQQRAIPPGPDSRRPVQSPTRDGGPLQRDSKEGRFSDKDRRSFREGRDRSPRSGRSRTDDERRSRRDERDDSRSRGRDGDRSRGSSHRDDRRGSSRSRNDDRRRSPHSRRSDSKSSRNDSDKRDDRREGSSSQRDDRRPRDDDKGVDQRRPRDRRDITHKPPESSRSNARGDAGKSQKLDSPHLKHPPQDMRAPLMATPPAKRDGLLPSPNIPPLQSMSPSDRAGLSSKPTGSADANTISKLASVDFDKLKASLASIRRQNLEAPREETPPSMKIEYGGDMDVVSEPEGFPGNEEPVPKAPTAPSHAHGAAVMQPNLHGAPMMDPHGPRIRRPPPPRMSLLGEAPGMTPRPRGPRLPGLMDVRLRGMPPHSRPRLEEPMASFNRPRGPLLETPVLPNEKQASENELFFKQVEQEILETGERGYGGQEQYYPDEVSMQHPAPMGMRPRLRGPRPPPGGRRMPAPGMRPMRPQGAPLRPRMCTTFGLRTAGRPLRPRGPPGRGFPPRIRPM